MSVTATPSPRRRAWVLLATVLGVALTASLGAWQLGRAAQKTAIQSALDSRALLPGLAAADLAPDAAGGALQHYRLARLRGHWVAERTVFLENRQMNARVGFYVVTPLQLEGRPEAVLVQRGWVVRNLNDRSLLPAVVTPAGLVEVEGLIAPPPARLYEFSAVATGAIRQNLDVASFATETGLRFAPVSLQQHDSASTVGDGLLRQWPRPAVDVQKHHGYAFQWFAMSALMAGLYVWFQLLRPRRKRDD
ncbi:MAG: SURF1 family protein [Burkholderiaceae bacterium]